MRKTEKNAWENRTANIQQLKQYAEIDFTESSKVQKPSLGVRNKLPKNLFRAAGHWKNGKVTNKIVRLLRLKNSSVVKMKHDISSLIESLSMSFESGHLKVKHLYQQHWHLNL